MIAFLFFFAGMSSFVLQAKSIFYTETLLGPHDALAYGSILQTHMPFMTHVTRCPVVPTALLCAARVDVSTNCRTGKNLKLCVGLVKHKYDCAIVHVIDILYILRIMQSDIGLESE